MSDSIKQLVFTKERELRWREINPPTISDRRSALVRPFVVARSDLDACVLCPTDSAPLSLGNLKQDAMASLAKRMHLDRYTSSAPVGQQCIAEVIETGPDVAGLTRGQSVIVPAIVSCGNCLQCVAGMTSQCLEFGSEFTFGSLEKPSISGGLVSDLVRIPNAAKMLVPLPESFDPLTFSSAGSDLADAWCSVMPSLLERKSARVLVLGGTARSTSLYAVAFAASQKVAVLDYLDLSAERVALAAVLGANAVEKTPRRHRGCYDIIVSGNTEAGVMRQLLEQLEPGGAYIQLQPQLIGDEKISLKTLFDKNLTVIAAKAHVLANLRPMLEYLSTTKLNLELVNTHIGGFAEAHEHFAKNTSKVVVHRPKT